MTLLEWVSRRWRTVPPVPAIQHAIVPTPTAKPRVPAEYLSLYTYLEHRYATMVVLSFDQMESLLGHALPEISRTRQDWWTDTPVTADRHSETWTAARRTATPNLGALTVAFERLP